MADRRPSVYDVAARAYAAAVNAALGNPPGYAAGLEFLADHPAFRAAVDAAQAAGRQQAAVALRDEIADLRGRGMVSAAWVAQGLQHIVDHGHRWPGSGERAHIHTEPG